MTANCGAYQHSSPVFDKQKLAKPDQEGGIAGPACAGGNANTLQFPLNQGVWTVVPFAANGAQGNGPANPVDPLQRNDDDFAQTGVGMPAVPFNFSLYGANYTGNQIFINNNGNLTFGLGFSGFTASGFPDAGVPPMVAPFWADVDTRNVASGVVYYQYRDDNLDGNIETLVVTWDNVGYFNQHADRVNTFQVAISDGTNPRMGIGQNICFSYDNMCWTTGDASGGVGGFGGVPATVGANKGDGVAFFQIGRFDHPGNDYDGPGGNNDGVDYLDGFHTCFVIQTGQDRVSAGEKGSLLFFSDIELKWNANGALTQDTFVQISNDNIAGVNVQMYFINGDPALAAVPAGQPGGPERAHPGWNNVDNLIYLTANQPSYWSVFSGQPGSSNPPPSTGPVSPFTVLDPGNPPGRPDLDPGAAPGSRYLRGFIIAFAINAAGDPIVWNHLFGNATVVNYARGTAFEYNAWAFQAVNPLLQTGQVIGAPGAGVLNLNGADYAPAFDQLLMNFQAVGATAFSSFASQVVSDSDLTLHLVNTDLRQNGTGPRKTKAKFDVWNQNEVKFSGAERCIICWEQRLLGNWAPLANHFTRPNLQTNVGKARINGERSDVVCPPIGSSSDEPLLGILSTLLNFNGGQAFGESGTNLFGLGFENAVIRYNVSPPPPPANAPDSPEGWINLFQHQINKALNVGKN